MFLRRILDFGRRTGATILRYLKSTYIPFWCAIIFSSIYSIMLVYSCTISNGTRTVTTQIIAVVIGSTAAVIISLMDYERLGELWWLVGGVCIFLVSLTFIAGQSAAGEGAKADDRAWLDIFGVSFQPSELMKIGFLITFSYHLSKVIKDGKLNSIPHLLTLVGHVCLPVGLIIIQRDEGSALMFLVMAAIIILGSGLNWKYIAVAMVGVLAALPLLWQVLSTTQKQRIQAVYSPQEGDELTTLYQQTLGRMAIGSGELTGLGWRKGTMIQSGLVPEDYNDFILTVAGEEFGFIGTTLILFLLASIMVMTINVALTAKDDMGRFICLGFFGLIAAQTIFNVGMVLVVLPVIGITLPFFSAGGSSSMCLYFGVGLVLSVYMRRGESRMSIATL